MLQLTAAPADSVSVNTRRRLRLSSSRAQPPPFSPSRRLVGAWHNSQMSSSSIAMGNTDFVLKERNVEVTRGAVTIGGKTYITKNITSVRVEHGKIGSEHGCAALRCRA
jgi:hypothetical protein